MSLLPRPTIASNPLTSTTLIKESTTMKKFILVLTAAAVSYAASAASVGWTLSGAANYANDAYQFFVVGQNGATSIEAIQLLLDAGTDVSSKAFASGTVGETGAASVSASNSGKTLANSASYTAFFVVYDTTSPTAGSSKYVIVSGASGLSKTVNATASSVSFTTGNQANYLNNTDNWKSFGPVPEPTTVALLAIGLAAVGLKRKVA